MWSVLTLMTLMSWRLLEAQAIRVWQIRTWFADLLFLVAASEKVYQSVSSQLNEVFKLESCCWCWCFYLLRVKRSNLHNHPGFPTHLTGASGSDKRRLSTWLESQLRNSSWQTDDWTSSFWHRLDRLWISLKAVKIFETSPMICINFTKRLLLSPRRHLSHCIGPSCVARLAAPLGPNDFWTNFVGQQLPKPFGVNRLELLDTKVGSDRCNP